MRLSITAISAQADAASASTAALDGRSLRARLAAEDTALDVVDADPGVDLAEQLDTMLAARAPGPRDAVMLYAACDALVSVDGELFLCLDPKQPTVGDALVDVTAALSEGAPGPKLLLLDLVDAKLGEDEGRAELLVKAAEAAVDPASSGVELLLAARPRGTADQGSPLAAAIIAEMDASPQGRALSARGLFDRLVRKLEGALPCFHHARAKMSFELIPAKQTRRESSASVPAQSPDAQAARASATPPPAPTNPPRAASAPAPLATKSDTPPAGAVAIPGPPRKPDVAPSIPPPPAHDVELTWADDDDDWATAPHVIPPARTLAAPPGASLPPPPMGGNASTSAFSADGPISSPISGREISPFARYTIEGELLASEGDADGAIAAFRKALSVLGPGGDPESRAQMYTRIGELRAQRGDTEDAISDFEKALALWPGLIPALESLLVLCAAERDWRGVMSAEERLIAALPSDTLRFERLMEFAARWEGEANKPARAKLLFERAWDIRPHDPIVFEQIRRLTLKSIPPPPKG